VRGRQRAPARTAVLVVTILLVGGAALSTTSPGARAAAPGPAAGAGLLLTADPSRGSAPLLVDFSLSTPNSSAPLQYEWAFGDGAYLNGSGASYQTPSHTYLVPGTYHAVATAVWAAGPENASVTIVVVSSVLGVRLAASPVNGTAPLTVTFNATPFGGSGTYLSYVWAFGDGGVGSGLDVRYTYATSGTFLAQITVTDSTGARASASANISVRPGGSTGPNNNSTDRNGSSDGRGPAGAGGLAAYLPEIAVGLLGVGVAVFLASAGWVLYRRRELPARGIPPGVELAAPGGAPVAPVPSAALAPEPEAPAPGPGPTPAPAPTAPEPSGLAASRRLALQLLRTMGTLPKVARGELAGPEWTQAGLAERVGAGQSAISRVLRRLSAAGIVGSETTHVAGGGRRVRVYHLTPRGERLAHALSEAGPSEGSDPLSGDRLPP